MSVGRIAGKGERITVLLGAYLKDIIPGFLDDWKQDVNSMRQALDGGDYEQSNGYWYDNLNRRI